MRNEIEQALDGHIKDISPLSGGCIGQVYRVKMDDGRIAVAKYDSRSGSQLAIEGYMLRYLSEYSTLPVPDVLYVADMNNWRVQKLLLDP